MAIEPSFLSSSNALTAEQPYNSADEFFLTHYYSQACNYIARPLSEHVFRPLGQRNHFAGLVAVNVSLTLVRTLETYLDKLFSNAISEDKLWLAKLALGGKCVSTLTDGLDGAVTRQSDLTSLAGAFLDPAVDMHEAKNESQLISARALAEGDMLTAGLMRLSQFVDAAVMASAGANAAAYFYLKIQGYEVSDRDKPRANAFGKAKFGAGFLARKLLMGSYATRRAERKTTMKRAGQAVMATSLIFAGLSIKSYAGSAQEKYQRTQQGFPPGE